jgi:histidine triad (HIT) family protein
MSDCLFCKIISGEIKSGKVFENNNVIGFKDIHPQAKIHNLFIHKTHTQNISEMAQNPDQLNDIFKAIVEFTKQSELNDKGFRLVINQGNDGGQTVFHTHIHLFGGEKLKTFGA